jgi:hypothetical protein
MLMLQRDKRCFVLTVRLHLPLDAPPYFQNRWRVFLAGQIRMGSGGAEIRAEVDSCRLMRAAIFVPVTRNFL